ncbi:hypothetical protein [Candidatus Lokiarchaeum ossiferum]|uniref:hypothetical protein n=1 Tax=Candidatus Lokiarchaeum ossiferum TaxID=2951803 RepID=UPI00352EE306
MTNHVELETAPFHLFYKEQWLCFAAFSQMSEKQINFKIDEMDSFIESLLNNEENFKEISPIIIPENRKIMPEFAKHLKAEINWHTIIPNFNYGYKDETYKIVGYFLIRLIPDSFQNLGFDIKEIRPNHLEFLINLISDKFRAEYEDKFYYDQTSIPYSITICSKHSMSEKNLQWDDEQCRTYKKEIGKWSDIYSGDYSDYKESFYDECIRPNLSNRTSEMHIILRNSALLYLEPHNYNRFFIKDEHTPHSTGYLYFFVLKTICSFHTIKFTLYKISEEIDKDALNLVQMEYMDQKIGEIKRRLDKTAYLKESLDVFIKPFLTDSLRNKGKHYSKIQRCCTEMYAIKENMEYIQRGIENNLQALNSIFIDKQNLEKEIQDEETGVQNLQNLTVTLISLFFGTDLLFEMSELLELHGWGVMDYLKLILMILMFGIFVILIIRSLKTRKTVKILKAKKKSQI